MIKLATVFSGIGAIEQALKQMNIEHEIVFACDNGERYLDIDQKSIKKQINGLSEEEKEKKIKEELGLSMYLAVWKPSKSLLSDIATAAKD